MERSTSRFDNLRRSWNAGPRLAALYREPQLTEALGSQFTVAALPVNPRLEIVEGDLAHNGVEHVLHLAGEHRTPAFRVGLVGAASSEKSVALRNTLAVSARVSGVLAISWPWPPART